MKLSEVIRRVKEAFGEDARFRGVTLQGNAVFSTGQGNFLETDEVIAKVELLEPEQPPSG